MSSKPHACPICLWGNSPQYWWDRSLGGDQNQSGCFGEKNILFLLWFEPWFVLPIACYPSSYEEYMLTIFLCVYHLSICYMMCSLKYLLILTFVGFDTDFGKSASNDRLQYIQCHVRPDSVPVSSATIFRVICVCCTLMKCWIELNLFTFHASKKV